MSSDKKNTKTSSNEPKGFSQHWHLSTTPTETSLTALEFSLFRSFEAFSRWQSECLATVTGKSMSGTDNAILHMVRMRNRPKSIKEIAMLLNRDDMPNLKYAIRKLLKDDLIAISGDSKQRKHVRYTMTEKGIQVTDDFAEIRKKVLVEFSKQLHENLDTSTRTLELMAGIYDQAARIAATHRGHSLGDEDSD